MPDETNAPLLSHPSFTDGTDKTLLATPRNVITKRIFVAATRMNEGKTTVCLGLFAALRSLSPSVGYIKPIGQRFVEVQGARIDEDSLLLDSIFQVEVPIEAMSPVAVDSNFTRRYLTNPKENLPLLVDRMCRAFDRVSFHKDYIIIEGTGHAGVGAIFDMSNAQAAKLFKAKVIIVSEGGIGRPVDEIAMNKALFDKHGVEVIGAILNKCIPDKIEQVVEHAGKGLARLGVPLLGAIPLQKPLTAPNLSQVVDEISGRWLNGRAQGLNERVTRIVIGAMTAKGVMDYLQPGVLMLTPGDRDDILLSAIAQASLTGKKIVSGIILTRNIMPHPKLLEMLHQTNIPVVVTDDESYAVASKIVNMTIKTQPQDTDKIPIIKRLILDNVDLQKILHAF
ncbi:MAG TPA: AAA family ATPase [Opitutales bacterium]|jgi:BioD-like phosphotransacetylase family protein|nr:AAA family ATPase [Opitutales bacterium]